MCCTRSVMPVGLPYEFARSRPACFYLGSQSRRRMISYVIASPAKQSSAQCTRPPDCFVASAPRNDARGLVLAMHLHPSGGHASNEKPRNSRSPHRSSSEGTGGGG